MSSNMEVNLEINIENLNQVKEALNQFPIELKNSLYTRMQRIANREEKILKSTTGFQDRTGRLRRELMAVAKYNPLSVEIGTYTPYGTYVAYPHGRSWKPHWWQDYIVGMAFRVPEDIKGVLERTVRDFNNKYKGE